MALSEETFLQSFDKAQKAFPTSCGADFPAFFLILARCHGSNPAREEKFRSLQEVRFFKNLSACGKFFRTFENHHPGWQSTVLI
jgi:hypothetical protein